MILCRNPNLWFRMMRLFLFKWQPCQVQLCKTQFHLHLLPLSHLIIYDSMWDCYILINQYSVSLILLTWMVFHLANAICHFNVPKTTLSWCLEKDFKSSTGFSESSRKLNETHRFIYTIVDLCQSDILIWNNITNNISFLTNTLVNNSTTTITIATSLSRHNESALLNKICENMEKQRQKRVKCVCQLLPSEANWGTVERFTRWWLCCSQLPQDSAKLLPSNQHWFFWLQSHCMSVRKYYILLEMTGKLGRLEIISRGE